VVITARTAGVLTDLRVKRGTVVKKDDIVAVLSDEAREAQVMQMQAVVTQKRTELEAKRQLIMTGALPRLQLLDLEAQLKAAEAELLNLKGTLQSGVLSFDDTVMESPVRLWPERRKVCSQQAVLTRYPRYGAPGGCRKVQGLPGLRLMQIPERRTRAATALWRHQPVRFLRHRGNRRKCPPTGRA
jgi:pyruvate/2-oxoglutarate dehydrogenase complex dihydrolipoamide acyltransferase (E2) component